MPFFTYTSRSSTHQKGSIPVFQFTYFSMIPNHCYSSVKLLKLAVKAGHNHATYYMGVPEQEVWYEHALPFSSAHFGEPDKRLLPTLFAPSSRRSWHSLISYLSFGDIGQRVVEVRENKK